ncbi:MAG: Surface antigen [Chloroflexi bacterium AL-W]|nr:Surface antigen [Chloroflexi bacterium AL-N1]NOK67338.1 Surface antigen [Chloroflexi bacterium AL-N10]NOK75170.1 Surface antigen [Chloroflexi bacterium AL-N5]NOK81958.1 Surface antigen [Chloroflexi bacterium AL-W]NOK89803.1 Surface antigen [Chloroflexi bacterium AL-N15]
MFTLHRSMRFVGLVVALCLLTTFVLSAPRSASAASWCWCTQYVYAAKGLGGGYGDAHTWDDNNGILRQNGYYQVSSPGYGDIVVYGTDRFGPYGHVGIVTNVNSSSLTVRGANQASSWATFTEHGCTNASQGNFVRRSYGETYWRR